MRATRTITEGRPQRIAEWVVNDGKPCLEIEDESGEVVASIRIPTPEAFREFLVGAMEVGCEAFPEIAAEDAAVTLEDEAAAKKRTEPAIADVEPRK